VIVWWMLDGARQGAERFLISTAQRGSSSTLGRHSPKLQQQTNGLPLHHRMAPPLSRFHYVTAKTSTG
jgi:hypothetical protein